MDAARGEIFLDAPYQKLLDRLLASGVSIAALCKIPAVTATHGKRHPDGRFDYHPRGAEWLAFEEDEDFVFWNPETFELTTAENRAFAIGEDNIFNAGTYSFDGWLRVHPEPVSWLAAKRDGIVIVDWSRTFDQLRDCPRILGETQAVGERIDALMHPARLPAIAVRKSNKPKKRRPQAEGS